MALLRYKGRIDKDGKLVVIDSGLAPGTEVEVDIHPVANDYTLKITEYGEKLKVSVVDVGPALTPEEQAKEEEILSRLAFSDRDFWDNEVDNAAWNNT